MKSAFRRLAAVLASAAAMMIVSGSLPLVAQESGNTQAPAKAKKTAKRAFDPTRRVPDYFGQLGLSEAQRESIYKLRAKHQPKIDELEKQLEDLRGQMVKECESVLTAAQKKLLEERRAGAAESRGRRGGGAAAKSQD
jgi:Spy/CpxP family protein refolding chaperone